MATGIYRGEGIVITTAKMVRGLTVEMTGRNIGKEGAETEKPYSFTFLSKMRNLSFY